jgi:hypothetical protein
MKTALKILLLGIALFFTHSYTIPGGYLVITDEMKYRAERDFFYYEIKDEPFSEELLKKVIAYERIRYPDVVLLQAQLETGFYTSDIFNNGHNCFGMKFPKYRPTVATGVYQGHSQYDHWIQSVRDYKIWQDWYISRGYRIESKQDDALYLVFLDCIKYAEDPHYIPKLVRLSTYKDLT